MSIYHCSTKKEDGYPMWVRKFAFLVQMNFGFREGVRVSEKIIDTPHALTSIIIGIFFSYALCECWRIITNKEKLLD